MEKVEISYKGVYEIMLKCPGFYGKVSPGATIEVEKKTAQSMASHDDWVVVAKKTKKGGDE